MIARSARMSAPTESAGVTCDASSKITTSKLRGQELRDNEWAHRPARLQRTEYVRRGLEQLTHWKVATFEPGLMLDHIGFARVLVACGGGMFGDRASHARHRRVDVRAIC
jgi:hypothetical protein